MFRGGRSSGDERSFSAPIVDGPPAGVAALYPPRHLLRRVVSIRGSSTQQDRASTSPNQRQPILLLENHRHPVMQFASFACVVTMMSLGAEMHALSQLRKPAGYAICYSAW